MLDLSIICLMTALVLTSSYKAYQDKSDTRFLENSVGIAVISSDVWTGLVFTSLFPPPLVSQYKLREKFQAKIDGLNKTQITAELLAMTGGRQPVLVSRSKIQRRILGAWFECGEL